MLIISLFSISLPTIYTPEAQKVKIKEELKTFFRLITNKRLIAPYLSIIIVFFNLGIITASYTIFLKIYEYSDSQIGMVLGIMVIFSILINYPAGKLGDKIGKVKVLLVGLCLCSVGFLMLLSPSIPFPYVGMAIFGLGHGCVFPISAGIVRDESSLKNRGLATGIFYALNVAGIAIGSPISGVVIELFNFEAALLLGTFIPIIFCIIFIIGYRSRP